MIWHAIGLCPTRLGGKQTKQSENQLQFCEHEGFAPEIELVSLEKWRSTLGFWCVCNIYILCNIYIITIKQQKHYMLMYIVIILLWFFMFTYVPHSDFGLFEHGWSGSSQTEPGNPSGERCWAAPRNEANPSRIFCLDSWRNLSPRENTPCGWSVCRMFLVCPSYDLLPLCKKNPPAQYLLSEHRVKWRN